MPKLLPNPSDALNQVLPLLGGLSARQFMRRHWQKRPLVIRQAIAGFQPLLNRAELIAMAQDESVESRLIEQRQGSWRMRHGPLSRRQIPPFSRPAWTLLIQGVDLHCEAAQGLMRQFSFLPAARMDDLMVSYASDQGGVGPHFDSYDVFLLQAQGTRRWRIGRQRQLDLVPGLPVKILADFVPEEEHLLEPGDMLYLPPRWAHEGVAQGECQTYSIGFRAPRRGELVRELLGRLADDAPDALGDAMYTDPQQEAQVCIARIPHAMRDFAHDALERALSEPRDLDRVLGELLTEPKGEVWFEAGLSSVEACGVRLDRRSRMLYDDEHIFANGESWRAAGRDALLLRQLADQRELPRASLKGASKALRTLLDDWCAAGWVHAA